MEEMESILCVVANVREKTSCGPYGQETSMGHRHFSAGTKVYILPCKWDIGSFERSPVVGMHRKSHRLVCIVMDYKCLTNWRVKSVYRAGIIRKIREVSSGAPWDETYANDLVSWRCSIEEDD